MIGYVLLMSALAIASSPVTASAPTETVAPEMSNDAIAELAHAVATRDAVVCRRLLEGKDFSVPVPDAVFRALDLEGCAPVAADSLTFATDPRALPIALGALGNRVVEVRRWAAESMMRPYQAMGAKLQRKMAGRLVAGLAHALGDPDVEVRRNALMSLAELGEAASGAMSVVASAGTADLDGNVRARALDVLAGLGLAARGEGPRLNHALALLETDGRTGSSDAEQLRSTLRAIGGDKDDQALGRDAEVCAAIIEHVVREWMHDAQRVPDYTFSAMNTPQPSFVLDRLRKRGVAPQPARSVDPMRVSSIDLADVVWIAADLAKVSVTFNANSMDSEGVTYTVALEAGAWKVVGLRGDWIT
jgi:hypothetical protein